MCSLTPTQFGLCKHVVFEKGEGVINSLITIDINYAFDEWLWTLAVRSTGTKQSVSITVSDNCHMASFNVHCIPFKMCYLILWNTTAKTTGPNSTTGNLIALVAILGKNTK